MIVPTMYRVFEPYRSMQESRRSKIHYESIDGRMLLCGHSPVFLHFEGRDIRLWHRTEQEMNCQGCRTAMEVIVRHQLHGLPGQQLEDLLARIAEYRKTVNPMEP